MVSKNFIPYQSIQYTNEEILEKSESYYNFMDKRRSLRNFSDRAIDRKVIKNLIKTASSAPSGAHKQPWTFVAISNKELKHKIREAAEKEEYENYHGRMSDEWLKDLEPFETDWNKEFIDIVPWIIVVFKKSYDLEKEGTKSKNYYVNESVGLATGFLLTAIHNVGLVSLTHTPSPMNFLAKILNRPENEKPFLLIPVGHPKENAQVPNLKRKNLDEMSIFIE